ncbi:MAG: cobalt-precorrin-5B (C(1))-methyltransferase CbiD [Lachnospiraceae bacterium]
MDYYVSSGGKRLRCGYTTGSCATLATKAAASMLLSKELVEHVEIMTPKGLTVAVDLVDVFMSKDYVSCAVKKDAGDDIDATNGALVYAKVSLCDKGIFIDGGKGVGRVTVKGLDQPLGSAAINSTPRAMITSELQKLAEITHYPGGFLVEISVPEGEGIAKKTFNEHIGIVGGISILGTTGIVEPQSVKALVDSIEVEFKMWKENGVKDIIISPGNYSDQFLATEPMLTQVQNIKCSNYIGECLDFANIYGYETVLVVGHIGKMVKLAAGIMNTHSREADGRIHVFASYAALCGASQEIIKEIMASKTTDACIEILEVVQLKDMVITCIIESAQEYLQRRYHGTIGILMFSNVYGLLGMSKEATAIIDKWSR